MQWTDLEADTRNLYVLGEFHSSSEYTMCLMAASGSTEYTAFQIKIELVGVLSLPR